MAMAQDLFLSIFAQDPYNSDVWNKYCCGVLEYSGSPQSLFGILENFLGRSPNMNAIVESLQVTESSG